MICVLNIIKVKKGKPLARLRLHASHSYPLIEKESTIKQALKNISYKTD